MLKIRFRRWFVAPLLVLLAMVALASGGCGAATGSSAQGEWSPDTLLPPTIPSEVLGELDGEALTLDELPDRDRFRLAQLKSEYFTEAHRALEEAAVEMARERLIERAASGLGMTVTEYFREEIGLPELSDAQARNIYEANRDQLGGASFEEAEPTIRRQVGNQMLAQAATERGDLLLSEAEWTLRVPAYRVNVETEGHASLGPEDAPVTVVVFSDFECPYCRRFNDSLDRVREEYGEQMRLVFRHYPLRTIHPLAQKAGEAAACAQDQGRFWEFHDALWSDPNLAPNVLEEHARMVGLDTEAFTECLNSGSKYERVQTDLEAAMDLGQSGTPAVFVNGRKVGGAIGYAQFRAEIERELPREDAGNAPN